ncbi:MAG: AraC family transcriptional regulator [Bacteroidales bacterium]|nr:AraC family transcriptional regulator [Bacteroidales bacterium]
MLNVTESMILAIALSLSLVVSLTCTILLWRRIKHFKDGMGRRAPFILAGMAVMLIIFKAVRLIILFQNPINNSLVESLPPITVLMALPVTSLILLYPMEVMRPGWLKWKHTLWFAVPWLIEVIISTQMNYTHLFSVREIIYHIEKPDVWWRLIMCCVAVLVNLTIVAVPYNRWKSSASREWLWTYFAFALMQMAFCVGRIMTGNIAILLLVECGGILYISWATYAELYELIPAPRNTTKEPDVTMTKKSESVQEDAIAIWKDIEQMMEYGVFRDPALNFDKLCQMLNSNRATVQQSLRENTGVNFGDYLDRVRISHTLALLHSRADIDIASAFFEAGYRTRTIASRSFKKVTGLSPEEWKEKHKG